MTAPLAEAPPRTVAAAYWLYLAGAVLSVVNTVITLVLLPSIIDVAVARATEQTRGQDVGNVDIAAIARGAAIASIAFASLVTIVFLVLTIVFARKMLRGRNWARIVLAVFAGLHLLGVVGIGGYGAAVAILSSLVVVTSVLAAVLTFLPVSNAWFRAMRPVRAPVAL